jgi:ketosteroid isomerase-like protein
MTDNPNLVIQERFVAAVLAGDTDTIHALCAPEFELHEGSGLPFAGTYHGAAGFLDFLGLFNEMLDIHELAPVRTFTTDDPDWLIGELNLRATLRATGKPFASSLLEMWQFREGKVISIKPHYFNAVQGETNVGP